MSRYLKLYVIIHYYNKTSQIYKIILRLSIFCALKHLIISTGNKDCSISKLFIEFKPTNYICNSERVLNQNFTLLRPSSVYSEVMKNVFKCVFIFTILFKITTVFMVNLQCSILGIEGPTLLQGNSSQL